MVALLKRYFKSILIRGAITNFVGIVIVAYLLIAATGGGGSSLAARGLIWLVVMGFFAVVMLAVLTIITPRPGRAKWHGEVVGPLVNSTEEYCLLLRPFGYDGENILPVLSARDDMEMRWWRRAGQGILQRTKPGLVNFSV